MTRDPRFDILFEPVEIGPVTARNRFYQVPHCTGMGYALPRSLAALREVKAEGGWGVVCTEYCSIHRSSDDAPAYNATLWDAEDVRAQALMVEGVHCHGSLAGVQLWYGGNGTTNMVSRATQLGVGSMPVWPNHPAQTRAMDKRDIRDLRRWHSNAAKRACQAGFDIIYVYATHQYMLDSFLSRDTNQRSDEYGGSIENRVRLVREIIEDTRAAIGDRCALAVRFSSDDLGGADDSICPGEQREMFEMLAELPDLWDINIYDWPLEAGTSRFVPEAALEGRVAPFKELTTKPVVGVGRFTSPETMVRQVKAGVLDMIGAARPSIADPFLPRKIEEGRIGDIRECIGCNICLSCHRQGAPIRCTQNPTMGEEWRRGWHPELIESKHADEAILVVGAGPAGLEATRALAQRGYRVTLAEATSGLGGRVSRESALPGLAEWGRVRGYPLAQIETMTNVAI